MDLYGDINMRNKAKSELYLCCCGTEGIKVEHYNDDEIYLCLWHQGHYGKYPMSFKERLRWIWHIFRTGEIWADQVVFTKETARDLGKTLMSITEESKISLSYTPCPHCNNLISPEDTLYHVCGK